MLVTQVPSCFCASPYIYHARITPGEARHLSALCLSIREKDVDKQEITE